jgi:dTDP-4-dehydrorhamnose 3,5-epimerase
MLPEVSIGDVMVREVPRHDDERGWLSELFRQDELDEEFHPVMSYLSMTRPGGARGPHEHTDQADLFLFPGPSTFRIYLWDNRPASATYQNHDRFEAGEANPLMVLVPRGVVHAYKNVGRHEGMVINCPNRLYAGQDRKEPVDEIRHEDDPDGPFQLD